MFIVKQVDSNIVVDGLKDKEKIREQIETVTIPNSVTTK